MSIRSMVQEGMGFTDEEAAQQKQWREKHLIKEDTEPTSMVKGFVGSFAQSYSDAGQKIQQMDFQAQMQARRMEEMREASQTDEGLQNKPASKASRFTESGLKKSRPSDDFEMG